MNAILWLVNVVWFWQLAVLRHSIEHPWTIVCSVVLTAAISWYLIWAYSGPVKHAKMWR
jgi:hypothetical protein